eukprot:6110937-Pleurochrysis_carterae.AAC.2
MVGAAVRSRSLAWRWRVHKRSGARACVPWPSRFGVSGAGGRLRRAMECRWDAARSQHAAPRSELNSDARAVLCREGPRKALKAFGVLCACAAVSLPLDRGRIL